MSHVPYLCLLHIYTYCPCFTGGAEGLPAVVLAGAVVAFLLLTLLIFGFTVGVVLWKRRAYKKGTSPQTEVKSQTSGNTKCVRGTENEEGTKKVHTYDVVGDDTSIDGRAALYQGLDVGTLDYVSEYTQLRGRTYQELDLRGREEEHHYQRANRERERHGISYPL